MLVEAPGRSMSELAGRVLTRKSINFQEFILSLMVLNIHKVRFLKM